jgi:hypothetical protein
MWRILEVDPLTGSRWVVWLFAGVSLLVAEPRFAKAVDQARRDQGCRKLTLRGEVNAGQEWQVGIGKGWRFRLVPIPESGHGYTGWNLVLDAQEDGGYPDALLLGTPPYDSLNEREVGTTFGLRAQDAIAWGPRRFHFLLSQIDLKRCRELFVLVTGKSGAPAGTAAKASEELLKFVGDSRSLGSGEFVVQDARLVLGTADPAGFAQQWAARLSQVPHTTLQSVTSNARGELRWIRFTATLLVPGGWGDAPGLSSERVKCPK